MGQMLPIQSPRSQELVDGLFTAPPPMWGPAHGPDTEQRITAAALVEMIRRHWLLIIGIFSLSVAAAFLRTRMTTPVYRASTTVYFADHQGSMPALDLLNKMGNASDEVGTEMEVIRSRALAGIVVDSLGLQARIVDPPAAIASQYMRVIRANPVAPDSSFLFKARKDGTYEVKNAASGSRLGIATPGQPFTFGGVTVVVLPSIPALSGFEVRVRPRPAAVDALLSSLSVTRPNRNASVVQVSYSGHDRVETKLVPDVLAGTYIAWRSSLRKSGDRSTVEFLRRQIDTISTQLYAAEESLRRFREANQVVDLPTQAQSEVQRLAALDAQRNDINIQRASLRSLVTDVNSAPPDPHLGSPYRRLMAFPGLMTPGNPAFPLLQSLTDLEQRRADLLVRRTANDPDVQSLSQAIASIESQIAAVVNTYLKGLDEQATSLASSVAAFHAQVDKVPKREMEYARLDRSATGLTQIYTMLQTRLREAQIAEAVDDGAVRVIDPAALPTSPIAPRPTLNLFLGGVLGVLLAFGAVVLRERLDHTVHTKEEVEAITGASAETHS